MENFNTQTVLKYYSGSSAFLPEPIKNTHDSHLGDSRSNYCIMYYISTESFQLFGVAQILRSYV